MPKQKQVGKFNPDLTDAVEAMLDDGYIEGLTVGLQVKYPNFRDEAQDAVSHAVEKLIQRESVDYPRAYLAASAHNYMNRFAKRTASLGLISIESGGPDGEALDLEDSGWTVEEQVLLDEAYRLLVAEVELWDTENLQQTTLLYLQAAYEGEPLTSEEAADLLSSILGEEVDAAWVRTWKSRGFKKLRKLLYEVNDESTGRNRTK